MKNEIKKRTLTYIIAFNEVSYAQLEEYWNIIGYQYQGKIGSYLRSPDPKEKRKIVIWDGWKEEAFLILDELIQEKKIERVLCEPYIYRKAGKMLNLPILRNGKMLEDKKIKSDFWFPHILRPTDGYKTTIEYQVYQYHTENLLKPLEEA